MTRIRSTTVAVSLAVLAGCGAGSDSGVSLDGRVRVEGLVSTEDGRVSAAELDLIRAVLRDEGYDIEADGLTRSRAQQLADVACDLAAQADGDLLAVGLAIDEAARSAGIDPELGGLLIGAAGGAACMSDMTELFG